MKRKLVKKLLISFLVIIVLASCKKDWLDAKPNQSLAVPHTLKDYKSLISSTMSVPGFLVGYGTLTEHSAGDLLIEDIYFGSFGPGEENYYVWKPDIWENNESYEAWNIPYSKIIYTNIVLEGIETIIPSNNAEQLDWNQTKASALFLRAILHYDVAKQFCKAYNKTTASTDLGIPLRLNSDFGEKSVRSTVADTYNQIIADLKEASNLAPITTPINTSYKCQTTKTAAYAMLSRVYLAMSDFDNALLYSDKALQLYNTLLDFNNTTTGVAGPSTVCINPGDAPFSRFNDEVIFYMGGAVYAYLLPYFHVIDGDLYNSYEANDLRKGLYFNMPWAPSGFTGSFDPDNLFIGLATDEIYLTRAECLARKGQVGPALADLNVLMRKRWTTGTWVDATAPDANTALMMILKERRKELLMRSIRWTDLKRLNLEPQFAVTLTKNVLGQTYTLPPNSPLYVFPIPPNVIQLTGMPQNPR